MAKAEFVQRRDCEAVTMRLERTMSILESKVDKINDNFIALNTQFNDLKEQFNHNLKGTVKMQVRSENHKWDIYKIVTAAVISSVCTLILSTLI